MANLNPWYPDAFVASVLPYVETFVQGIKDQPVVIEKMLPTYGAATVDELTNVQKGELACQYFIWSLKANTEANDAQVAAYESARNSIKDEFE